MSYQIPVLNGTNNPGAARVPRRLVFISHEQGGNKEYGEKCTVVISEGTDGISWRARVLRDGEWEATLMSPHRLNRLLRGKW
jgi:hypothetical protein